MKTRREVLRNIVVGALLSPLAIKAMHLRKHYHRILALKPL